MKKILIIRHGKSSWEHPENDLDRDLIEKGVLNSERVASKVKSRIPVDSLIWSSNAKRAYKTAQLFIKKWNWDSNTIQIVKDLYTFDSFQLEQIVKSCPNDCKNLILFGHNSAITDFVNKFGDVFIDNVPTSGFVSIIFDTDSWSSITKGKTIEVLFPRDI